MPVHRCGAPASSVASHAKEKPVPKAAADVVRSILFSAITNAVEALKASSGGLPNNLLRHLQSIHRNSAFADLPKEVQESIAQSVHSAFGELLKEGYVVAPRDAVSPRRPPARHEGSPERRGPTERRFVRGGPGRRGPDRPGGGPGKGPRPPRKPRPE